MLTARKAIAMLIGLSILSIGSTVYNLAKEPDGDGMARNSYGTRAHGFRGIYETLDKLKVSTGRSLVPPPLGLKSDDTLVILNPMQRLVELEPAHLRRTGEWIEQGGHAVIALSPGTADSYHEMDDAALWDTTILEELGLDGIDTRPENVQVTRNPAEDQKANEERDKRREIAGYRINSERETGITTVTVTGSYTALGRDVKMLRLPKEDLQTLRMTSGALVADGTLTVPVDGRSSAVVAAIFAKGKGQVTVISDSALACNYLVDKADNAVLAANLMVSLGGKLVFDEFYHGLNSRGNPLWLLTRPNYGWLFILVVLGVGVWVWRQSTVLGEALPQKEQSRRTITEYLDAMATLFTTSRQYRFVLKELRDGVLWRIREQLFLPPEQEKADRIIAALERHDPERARRLRTVNEKIEQYLAGRRSISEVEFMEAAKEINRCL